jgi:hypothetical protein
LAGAKTVVELPDAAVALEPDKPAAGQFAA